MSTPKDGGPAFPRMLPDGMGGYSIAGGMSLRDYFAGQALVGAVGHEDFGTIDPYSTALNCYAMADAVLAARERKADK